METELFGLLNTLEDVVCSLSSDALECRILAVVDAYDAITSDCPYGKALSHQEAVAELKRCSGKQFDLEIAEIFLEIVESRKQPKLSRPRFYERPRMAFYFAVMTMSASP